MTQQKLSKTFFNLIDITDFLNISAKPIALKLVENKYNHCEVFQAIEWLIREYFKRYKNCRVLDHYRDDVLRLLLDDINVLNLIQKLFTSKLPSNIDPFIVNKQLRVVIQGNTLLICLTADNYLNVPAERFLSEYGKQHG